MNGIGQYAWNMVHGLARTGEFSEINVLTQRPLASLPQHVFEPGGGASALVHTRYLWTRDDLTTTARLARVIRTERPDAVWLNLDFTMFGASRPANFLGLMAPLMSREAGRPLVVTLHQMLEASPPRTIGAKNGSLTSLGLRAATQMVLRADTVCVTLQRYAHLLETRYGARNVVCIPHGAVTEVEHLPHPDGGAPDDILFFGFAAPFKGLTTLLEAYEQLRARGRRVTLTIAGPDHKRFPGYQADLRAGLGSAADDGIRWLGQLSESQLREAFARARVVVLPYTATTGGSSVLNRAAAFGRPVVISDLPDLRAAAEESGLLAEYVPPADAESLAHALDGLLLDRARQARLARHNLAAMRRLTLDNVCARYLDLFRQSEPVLA
ncbi:MAG: glycosyltransferase family 4 protein [Anaerolineales bacterium]